MESLNQNSFLQESEQCILNYSIWTHQLANHELNQTNLLKDKFQGFQK